MYERLRRGGAGGGGGPAVTSGGFSAQHYYDQNATSAGSSLAPPPQASNDPNAVKMSSIGTKNDTARPFSNVGKFNMNLFGTGPTPPSPEHLQQPGPFAGTPIGSLFDAAGAIGQLPGVASLVGGPGYGAMRTQQMQLAQKTVGTSKDEYLAYALQRGQEEGQNLSQNWLDNYKYMVDYSRDKLIQSGQMTRFAANNSMVPVEDNLGGAIQGIFGGLSIGSRLVQRGLSGIGPLDRVNNLKQASDADLEHNTELIRIRDEARAGKLDDNAALDELNQSGYSLFNPMGQQGIFKNMRELTNGTVLDLPLEVTANFLAAGASGITDALTDPVTALSLGTGKLVSTAMKGSAKVFIEALSTVEKRAIEGAVARGEAEAGSAAAEDIGKLASGQYRRQLGQLLPEGVEHSDANIVRYALQAGDPGIQEAMGAAGRLARPFVGNQQVLNWAHMVSQALDPISLFGGDILGRATNRAVALHILTGGVDSLGKHNIAPVFTALEKAGIKTEVIGGDLGTAFSNIGTQIGSESLARNHAMLGVAADEAAHADPAFVTNMARDMLQRHGHDVESMVRHKMDKIALLVTPNEGETMASAIARERTSLANSLSQVYSISSEAAAEATRQMSPQQMAVVRFMLYGTKASELLNARGLSISSGDAARMGLTPEFIQRVIFLGPTTLDKSVAKDLRRALASKNMKVLEDAVEKYDILEWNIPQGLKPAELREALTAFLDAHERNLPEIIDPAKLTPAMQAYKARFGDDVRLALRGEDVFAAGVNEANKIVSIDPFIDYIKGADMGINDIKPAGRVDQFRSALTKSISGSQIVIEQNRRFAQRMAQLTGMPREQTDEMLRLIRAKATEVHASTARGLTEDEIYGAAMKMKLSKTTRAKVTSRELQRAVFFAHEGSLGKVGLTQKFTGMAKRTPYVGYPAAFMAERIYPLVRFRWNSYFQMQEGIETPIMLIARGWASPRQFTGPLTGALEGAKAAVSAPGGTRRAAFREAKEASVEEARDIEYLTATMMDRYKAGVSYKNDMAEASKTMMRGSSAAAEAASSTEGRALTALKTEKGIARIKTRGQLMAYRKSVGENFGRMMKRESPETWDVMRAHYGGSDDEVAIRWFNDLLMRDDPDSAFSAVQAHSNPGDFFRPSFLGAHTRWSHNVVMGALGGELPVETTTWAQFRKMYNDPKNTTIDDRWLEERLRDLGADEWYITRTKFHLDFPDEAAYEKGMADLVGPEMAAVHMDYHRVLAKAEGVPLIESLADKYAGPILAWDEHGVPKDQTLFQLIVDSQEKRGMEVVPIDHESVIVGGGMAQDGAPNMPDIGLPEDVGALEWESHALAQHTELVPLSYLAGVKPGNAANRMTPKELKTLAGDIKSSGMREPIQLSYSTTDRTIEVGEGNHRIAGLIQQAKNDPAKMGKVLVPVTVFRQERALGGTKVAGAAMDEFGYVPANLRPSDIGIGNAEAASIMRHDTAMRRDRAVKDLTPGQAKGREYQQDRVRRTQDPGLGVPGIINGVEDGRLVARNPVTGEVTHRIGGRKTMPEWLEEVQSNMTNAEIAEHARWYSDMRRGFMSLTENQQQEATHLLMAFGITQLNTSPIDGMKFMLNVVESFAAGKELPAQAKALQKVAGLNGEALVHLMEKGYLSERGMGQKLIDFVDSLIGTDGRTVPVRGPEGRWGAVAGDIWAKRDVGYLDAKMLNHLRYAFRDSHDVVKVRVGGKETFKFTDRASGKEFTVDPSLVGGNPNGLEYDHIVEFYNEAADYMNKEKFLGRTDWAAADAQAVGWFKAKKVMGDATGDPRAAFYDSVYHTRVDVRPRAGSPMSELYPSVSQQTSEAIAGRTANHFNDEANRLAGTRTISSHQSIHVDPETGLPQSATNFDVMASPPGIRDHLAVLGSVSNADRVRATRATVTRPTKSNGVRHMVEITFPNSISEPEMHSVFRQMAEDHPTYFGDADFLQRADGTWTVRVVSNEGEDLKAFTARMNDVQLREYQQQFVSPEGYARGRYQNPDGIMEPNERERAINDRGKTVIADSLANPTPIGWAEHNADELKDTLWQSLAVTDENKGWGGATVDLHNGKQPKGYGEKRGGGPYSTGISDTVSLPLDVDEATFKAAVDAFIETNRGLLERPGARLGVFRDIDPKHNSIDIDVNLMVDSFDDVEGVQLYLKRRGGAYDFTTGKGVYSPVFDPNKANEVYRGFADVVEMKNDWKVNPNGEAYAAHLRGGAKPGKGSPYAERTIGELEREGIPRGRMVIEDAYQSLAARETAHHRISRGLTDSNFDPGNPAGHLESVPRGSSAARLGVADARRGDTLYQRAGAGGPRGAATNAGAAISTTPAGRAPTRAQLYVHPTRKLDDTLAHEEAHDFINRYLDPSARRRAKALYAEREGTNPVVDVKSRDDTLTVDEQEWLADQLVEALRQGPDAVAHPALKPLAGYYSKFLKAKRERVPPNLTSYNEQMAAHATAMTGYEARRAAHEVRRAEGLNPPAPVAPTVATPRVVSPEDVSAYNAGFAASTRSETFDLDAASSRYQQKNPGYKGTEYERGWADAASGNPKSPPRPTRTIQEVLDEANALTGKKLNAKQSARMMELQDELRTLKAGQAAAVPPADVAAEADAIRAVYAKHDSAMQRSPTRMETDLDKLEAQGIDMTDERHLLEDYNDIAREDYPGDYEGYQGAREDTWNDLLDSINSRADTHAEEYLPSTEAAAVPPAAAAPAPKPVDIGEFPEQPPTPPVKPRGTTQEVTVHPDVQAFFNDVNTAPMPTNAHGYDVDEQTALNWMYAAHRRADRVSKDLIHFKSDRSWLERSLNHPYFGMYPLSYMWGKIGPEIVEMLAARPFGMKAPLAGLEEVHKLYQHSMQAMENDQDLREFMTQNEAAFRAMAMLVPGLPWDLPVNAPLWLRRYVEKVAQNVQADREGKKPEGYNAWNTFVSDIPYQSIGGDVVKYAMGPYSGTNTFLEYPGLAANTIGHLTGGGQDQQTPGYAPTGWGQQQTPGQPGAPYSATENQQPASPAPVSYVQPAQPQEQDLSPDNIEELQATLGGQFEDVASRISNGG